MKSRKIRITTALVTFGLFVALAGLLVPAASAATKLHFEFLNDPASAVKNTKITASAFDTSGDSIQVQLQDELGNPVTNTKTSVRLTLAGNGPATAVLTAPTQTTTDGIATFTTLSINMPNEPEFTDYQLTAVSAKGPLITGGPSAEFDIWGTADGCVQDNDPLTTNEICAVGINHHLIGGDSNSMSTYSATTGSTGNLSASTIAASLLPELDCEGYEPFFADSLFVNASTGTGAVFVSTRITRRDMKAVANNGQAHIGWCVGLVGPAGEAAWVHNGAENVVGYDMDGVPGDEFFVALAPPCPSQSPETSAPCISAQYGDGAGGNITEGYLPAGDPPRRT